MILKPPSKRIKFEKLLRELGYRDRSPILAQNEKKKIQINYYCEDGSAMAVYLFLIPYLTKKSYLYQEFIRLKIEKDHKIKEKIHNLAKLIKLKEKARIGDIGWEVKYTKQPEEYELKDRAKIIFNLFKQFIEAITHGMYEYTPRPGDILAARPYGPKINEGFNENSIAIGSRQRYLVAKRVGFGTLQDDGFCYARYDNDLILRSI